MFFFESESDISGGAFNEKNIERVKRELFFYCFITSESSFEKLKNHLKVVKTRLDIAHHCRYVLVQYEISDIKTPV